MNVHSKRVSQKEGVHELTLQRGLVSKREFMNVLVHSKWLSQQEVVHECTLQTGESTRESS
jgi:hypothetical protein